MVKKILIFFIYLIFFITSIIYFMPKVNLYYFLEHKLKPSSVIISMEEVEDKGLNLEIQNAKVFFKSIESAEISKINLSIFLIFNKLNAKNITLSSITKSFIPTKIDNIDVVMSVLNPLNAHIYATGEFGKAYGVYNIIDKSLKVKLTPSNIMKTKYKKTLMGLKKSENGEYEYVKNF